MFSSDSKLMWNRNNYSYVSPRAAAIVVVCMKVVLACVCCVTDDCSLKRWVLHEESEVIGFRYGMSYVCAKDILSGEKVTLGCKCEKKFSGGVIQFPSVLSDLLCPEGKW